MTQALHDTLINCIPSLRASAQNLASDLCQKFRKWGSFTPGQRQLVLKLIEEGALAAVQADTKKGAAKLDLGGINKLFDNAKASGMKRMALRFRDEAGDGFSVSPAKADSRNPGCLYVKSAGGTYLGKIDKDGNFAGANYGASEHAARAQAALIEFNKDPIKQAKAYGFETGNCCFCGLLLTDERSVTAGYGPVCAERWGLDWGSKTRSSAA